MQIVTTIIPIFIIVALGWLIRLRGFMPPEFLGPANRLVFYVAIPAMIFLSISKSTLHEWFNPVVIGATLAAAVLTYLAAWLVCTFGRMERNLAGTFIQSAGHGNLGYVGLAVAFYFLGDTGLVHASVVAGFLMILQNLLSVMALQAYAPSQPKRASSCVFVFKILGNPVILSVIVGLAFSFFEIPIPTIVERSLSILKGLALPTALLVIGASVSLERIRERLAPVLLASAMKLFLLPGVGWLLFILAGFGPEEYLPGLILLASPTATISYVMSKEMHGNPDFAAAAISASTLGSSVTYMLWLRLATG